MVSTGSVEVAAAECRLLPPYARDIVATNQI